MSWCDNFEFRVTVLNLLKSDTKISSFVNTRQLPMVVQPRQWTDPDTGGYVASQCRY